MDRKEFEKFLQPTSGLLVIAAITGAFFLILLFGGALLPALIPLVPTAICGWVYWSSLQKFKQDMDALEASGRLAGVLRDFFTGKQFFKGSLRLGPTYILGKNSGQVLSYGQIKRVYQYVHKTNFSEDRRELRVQTVDGKIVQVCKLPLRGKGDQELTQAIYVMKAINPGITIGYQ